MLKKIISAVYILIIVSLGAATIIEKYQGTGFVAKYVYGSWWMCMLWTVLAALGVFYIIKRHCKKISMLTLHLSFVVILTGALLTHLTAIKGMIHLRKGETTKFFVYTNEDGEQKSGTLPFSIRLDNFSIKKHAGTDAAEDYVSDFTIIDKSDSLKSSVSMNNIYSHGSTRLYQTSFDEDENGSYLSINSDPYGITVTYIGYSLLFIGLIWILIDPKGKYRKICRQISSTGGASSKVAVTLLLLFTTYQAKAVQTLTKEQASKFCKINMIYNDRVCPVQTYALDFTKKMYGKRYYKDFSAEQVLTGFLFWYDEWKKEPIIKIKDAVVCERLHLPKYCSLVQFITDDSGYILGPFLNEYYRGMTDKFHQGINKIDEKIGLIMDLHQLGSLKLFPYTHEGETTWYAANDDYPDYIEDERKTYMNRIFAYLNDEARNGKTAEMDEAISKIIKYQQTFGGSSIPSATRLKAEYNYNAIPFATILFMVNLTMGFLAFFFYIYRIIKRNGLSSADTTSDTIMFYFSLTVTIISFLALSYCIALRWIAKGTIPMSNGYETMLSIAWMIMMVSLIMCRQYRILLSFGLLLSGFFLLVSHISQMDPQISHLMPVLSSPLLTIHVSIIMLAYALIALTFICGLTAIIIYFFRKKNSTGIDMQIKSLQTLSQLFLYPAITALGFGIFIGAIWANVSWGTYWSWDPKETWALITMMVYAMAIHDNSFPAFRRPMFYHIYITLAFFTILMTYFGVNYFLGGMHSYA